VAAITAAICTGKDAHEDSKKRYLAGIACGLFYMVVGIFGVTLASLFLILPTTFIATLAGLALLGTIGGSLANALTEPKGRETALITFLATAANVTLLGVGGAFWGLVAGLAAHALIHGQFRRKPYAADGSFQGGQKP
ncbi:benzoate transporter, partial [Paenibacillus sp. A3]|uniref:benzoate/H(+) symporter BenE family transporter n=1 Tax=Paenibacillus sp. A3 TaxID=1337054 RepID=UPI0006E66913